MNDHRHVVFQIHEFRRLELVVFLFASGVSDGTERFVGFGALPNHLFSDEVGTRDRAFHVAGGRRLGDERRPYPHQSGAPCRLQAWKLALSREPTEAEIGLATPLVKKHGLKQIDDLRGRYTGQTHAQIYEDAIEKYWHRCNRDKIMLMGGHRGRVMMPAMADWGITFRCTGAITPFRRRTDFTICVQQ